MYFGDVETCGACNKREAKVKRLTAHYTNLKKQGTFNIQFAIINCYWRQKLTLAECAKVLGITEDAAHFARDLAIQRSE